MGSDARPRSPALSGIAIARAEERDLADVAALEEACYSDPWSATSFAALPDNPNVFFAVAREIGHGIAPVLGYVVAWYVLDEGELANLAVAAQTRGRGIGKALLAAVIRDAEGRGIADLFLEVRESNIAAIQLYQGQGFEQVGRRKGYYRRPEEDALVLCRRLGERLR